MMSHLLIHEDSSVSVICPVAWTLPFNSGESSTIFDLNSVLPRPIRIKDRLAWPWSKGRIKGSSIRKIGRPNVPKCPNVTYVLRLSGADARRLAGVESHSTVLGT